MAYDATPLIPRDVLFSAPDRSDPAVSPNGKLVGHIARLNGAPNVWVGPIDESAPAHPATNVQGRGVTEYAFCHDDHTLLYVAGGDDETARVHLLDLDTGQTQPVSPAGDTAQVLGHNRWHPTTVLVGLNRQDIYRLNLATSELELVDHRPGFESWIIDTDLNVRGGLRRNAPAGATLCLRDQAGEYVPYKTLPVDDLASTQLLGLARENSALLLLSSVDANTVRLLSIDVTTGAERVLAEDPRCDIRGVIQDPRTLAPQAIIFARDRDEWLWLDHDIGVDVEEFRRKLRVEDGVDGEIALHRSERTDRMWLISISPSDGPSRHYVFDRDDKQSRLLFSERPALDDYRLAPMESFTFLTRDGVTQRGYVTYPSGGKRHGLPAVLLVAADSSDHRWGLHPEVQWLANRGYACLNVNARGGVDAVQYAADSGWIDKTRVGIMDDSRSGDAALAVAAAEPGYFACAVGRSPTSDPHDTEEYRATTELVLAKHLGGRVQAKTSYLLKRDAESADLTAKPEDQR